MKNQDFLNLVEEMTWNILDQKPGTPGRQSIATTRGQQVELAAKKLLSDHPNVESIETQVFDETIDEFSNIDLVINTKCGKRVFVPCARDLWLGTSQQDRLQIVWSKRNSGVFSNNNVVYLVLDDVENILNKKFTKRARRGVTIQKCCQILYNENTLMNLNHLWDYLNNV